VSEESKLDVLVVLCVERSACLYVCVYFCGIFLYLSLGTSGVVNSRRAFLRRRKRQVGFVRAPSYDVMVLF